MYRNLSPLLLRGPLAGSATYPGSRPGHFDSVRSCLGEGEPAAALERYGILPQREPIMNLVEYLGWLACGLVMLAFIMTAMVPLRIAALCGNLAFIAYGYLLGLEPVLALHVILLPINACRLIQELRRRRGDQLTLIRDGAKT
jgi:hypothetical protein